MPRSYDLPAMLRTRCTAGGSDERALVCQAADEIERLMVTNRKWSQIADERSKENATLRQLLRDTRGVR